MRGLLRRRLADPLLLLLKQGLTPETLALSLALGATLGLFPVVGATTALCVAAGVALRLSHPALQLANLVVYPLQLPLVLVFVRLGERIVGAAPMSFLRRAPAGRLSRGPARVPRALRLDRPPRDPRLAHRGAARRRERSTLAWCPSFDTPRGARPRRRSLPHERPGALRPGSGARRGPDGGALRALAADPQLLDRGHRVVGALHASRAALRHPRGGTRAAPRPDRRDGDAVEPAPRRSPLRAHLLPAPGRGRPIRPAPPRVGRAPERALLPLLPGPGRPRGASLGPVPAGLPRPPPGLSAPSRSPAPRSLSSPSPARPSPTASSRRSRRIREAAGARAGRGSGAPRATRTTSSSGWSGWPTASSPGRLPGAGPRSTARCSCSSSCSASPGSR